MKFALSLGALALLAHEATAECPNGCSGHGTCGGFPKGRMERSTAVCACFNNYQSNDCSERTCYFGIAHVDTPKGDLDGDGYVSGPLTTILTGSEIYPWGTTEQYPNSDQDEGHFYMECSNKGICDRSTGVCDCFDGYTGTACMRAACANDCSGHGTCESIKELAEMKDFDRTANHMSSARTVGSPNSGENDDFDLAIEESYAYDLWDQDKSMGCKCDPTFFGHDCSLQKCKYGVDPLYSDRTESVMHQSTAVHLGSKSTNQGAVSGHFRIVFFDVFGERYVTKPISATRTEVTGEEIRLALEELPNAVISHTSMDTTGTPPAAVHVSMAASNADTDTYAGIGQGAEGQGAGIGTYGTAAGAAYGPEFTVTFKTNPGVTKGMQIDTRLITNPGSPDYWVAPIRAGEFSTRYANNVGLVNNMMYGSKLLYTEMDLTSRVATNGMIRIGQMEARVAQAARHMLTLTDPWLGASIMPVLTDTGAVATALDLETTPNELTIEAPGTTIIANNLKSGARLYAGGCPFVSKDPKVRVTDTAIELWDDHDCNSDIVTNSNPGIIYRRNDDPANFNVYATTADVGRATQTLLTTRGSSDVYIVSQLAATTVKAYTKATSQFVATTTESFAANDVIFVNGHGPIKVLSSGAGGAGEVNIVHSADADSDFVQDKFANADFDSAAHLYPIYKAVADTNSILAGSVVALTGRRYKVASRTAAGGVANAKLRLENVWAGGALVKVCTACITGIAADGTSLTSNKKVTLPFGEKLLVGNYVTEDFLMTVSPAVTDSLSITISAGTHRGAPVAVDDTMAAISAGAELNLYRTSHTSGLYAGAVVQESDTATTFTYVHQCSARGACDHSTGICKCFKGYSNDNCDTQNILAM